MKNIGNILKDRETIIIVLLLTTIIFLWFLENALSNNLYQESVLNDNTEQSIDTFSHENNTLKLELLQKASYTQIASEAAATGFLPAPFITP